jgi:hypothetical protein
MFITERSYRVSSSDPYFDCQLGTSTTALGSAGALEKSLMSSSSEIRENRRCYQFLVALYAGKECYLLEEFRELT